MLRIFTRHKKILGILCIVVGLTLFNLFSIALIIIGLALIVRSYSGNKPEYAEDEHPLSNMEKNHVYSDVSSGQTQMINQQMGNSPISQAYISTCTNCGSKMSSYPCTRCRLRRDSDKITQFI